MQIITVNDLCKSYFVNENKNFKSYFLKLFGKVKLKEIKALKGISFKVDLGETIGFIGRNGAGKSTTIKLLTGILKPTSGYIKVLGRDPFTKRQINNYYIGAVFGQRCQLRWDVSAYESFKLLKNIYKVKDIDFNNRLNEFREILDLDKFLHQPVRTLSLGQKMRVELCSAFLHNPKIVFLDEPTIGLDIFSKTAILNFLKKIKSEGNTTIFLTTHDISDIEELCERTIIIEEGTIQFDGLTKDIKSIINIGSRVVFSLENKKPYLPFNINNINNYNPEISDNKIILNNVMNNDLPLILGEILKNNKVLGIEVENPDFKEILKEFYKKNKILVKEGENVSK
ncbi:MAG: ATP-binding cassette domain-containing protein [Exilispira sp.]|jgi:ABC-2 type transport system ATP-binding protein|nr:ATP-binding cassette domain-containing protein [Exilispira sp.]